MANLTRRQWLKVGLAVGGMVTFGLSYVMWRNAQLMAC